MTTLITVNAEQLKQYFPEVYRKEFDKYRQSAQEWEAEDWDNNSSEHLEYAIEQVAKKDKDYRALQIDSWVTPDPVGYSRTSTAVDWDRSGDPFWARAEINVWKACKSVYPDFENSHPIAAAYVKKSDVFSATSRGPHLVIDVSDESDYVSDRASMRDHIDSYGLDCPVFGPMIRTELDTVERDRYGNPEGPTPILDMVVAQIDEALNGAEFSWLDLADSFMTDVARELRRMYREACDREPTDEEFFEYCEANEVDFDVRVSDYYDPDDEVYQELKELFEFA